MPLFEYKCRDCGTKFEKLVTSYADDVVCRNCQSPRVDKLLSVFAVAGSLRSRAASEASPCDACGAPWRGMCQEWQRH
jgi:putative FmdB family regulatory protein